MRGIHVGFVPPTVVGTRRNHNRWSADKQTTVMLMTMARKPDPTRKPALIQQALDFLVDKPLSSLTFRSLAKALDVSTFTLVYHFGTRAELIRDIVRANARGVSPEEAAALPAGTLEEYVSSLYLSWQWTQLPENLHRVRLEFEAGLLEAVARGELTVTRTFFGQWRELGTSALIALGVEPHQAAVESRLLINMFHGMQYDLVLNRDLESSTAAFESAVRHHQIRVAALIAESAR